MNHIRLVSLSCFFFLQAHAFAQDKENTTRKTLAGNIASGKIQPAAVKQLMDDANVALQFRAFSVTGNAPVPPSKRRNDFYSWAPYLWPNPNTKDGYPYITKDGQTNPETEGKSDKPLLRKMAVAVHTLALAYHYSNDVKYAKKSLAFIRTWFLDSATRMNPNLDYAQCTPGIEKGTATGIIDSRWFILVIDAVGMLKESGSLCLHEEKELKRWFTDYLNWLLTSEPGRKEGQQKNNHGSWYAAQAACYAWFTENRPLTEKIVRAATQFIDTQVDSAGRQIYELTRTKSFDYSLYNVHALITLAQVGDKVNIDLWHYNEDKGNNRNIRGSIKYLAGFAAPDKKWPYPQIAEKAISLHYEDGDHFSVYYPYDLYAALRIGYKVYRDPLFLKQIDQLKNETKGNRANLVIDTAQK